MKKELLADRFVIYVESCEPKLKIFYLDSELKEFVRSFLLENQDNSDNYIDIIYNKFEIEYCSYKVDDPAEAQKVSEEFKYSKTMEAQSEFQKSLKDYEAKEAVTE